MAAYLRRRVSKKIAHVLDQLPIVKESHRDNMANKLDYFTKLNKVDKNSKEFGVYTIDLAAMAKVLHMENIDELRTASLLKDVYSDGDNKPIERCRLEKGGKISVSVNLRTFKENILRSVMEEKSSYGFLLDAHEVYPKVARKSDRGSLQQEILWPRKLSKSRTIVEFSSPNIAKPLHAGHMRSTFLGNFLSNVHERLGDRVTRINYLGDWGTQYGLLAVGFDKYGSPEKLRTSPIKHLLEVYVAANKDESLKTEALRYFAQMEQKDEKALQMWTLFKDLSIKELESVYRRLNIEFDVYETESQYYESARDCVRTLLEKGIAEQLQDGAVQVKINADDHKNHHKYIVQKNDGSTLYITRDIAALLKRAKVYDFNKIIYVVDSSQRDHFQKLYSTVNKLDANVISSISFDEFYAPFGRLTNMSTRKGKVEFLSDLIEEAKQVSIESMDFSKNKRSLADRDHVAQVIGNSHLIITDLGRPRLKDYEFSWANIVSKDDSAYMCHYAHARLHSLLTKCKQAAQIDVTNMTIKDVNVDLLNSPIELALIQHIGRFEQAVWQSYREYEPYHIVIYMFQLVRLTNLCLKDKYVMEEELPLAQARLVLYECSKQVIANSFRVLGITPLEQI